MVLKVNVENAVSEFQKNLNYIYRLLASFIVQVVTRW